MIYFVVFLFEAAVCYFYDKKQMNNKRVFSIHDFKLRISFSKGFFSLAIIVPLLLVMGLRYNIGTDYRNYEDIFTLSVFYKKNIYGMEWAYYYLNRIAGSISDNPQIIFFIVACIIIFFFYKGIEKNDGSMYYGVLAFIGMGYFFYAMNIQRQYMAIMIMLYGFYFLEKKNFKLFLICVVGAAGFHTSVIIWIPVYFAVNYIPTKLFYVGSLGIAFLINRFAGDVLRILSSIGFYTNQIMMNTSFFSTRMSLSNVLLSSIFLLCGVIFYRKLKERGQKINVRFKIIWLMFLIYALFYQFGDAATRIATYMCIMYFLIICDIVNCFDIHMQKFIRILVTAGFLMLMYIIITYTGNRTNAFLPYQYRLL